MCIRLQVILGQLWLLCITPLCAISFPSIDDPPLTNGNKTSNSSGAYIRSLLSSQVVTFSLSLNSTLPASSARTSRRSSVCMDPCT